MYLIFFTIHMDKLAVIEHLFEKVCPTLIYVGLHKKIPDLQLL